MSWFSSKRKPRRNAGLLQPRFDEKVASERARLCPNLTRSAVNEHGDELAQGPQRDELQLWRALDLFHEAMSDMIDGDSTEISILLGEFEPDNHFGLRVSENNLHEFLSGAWQPNYSHWLDVMRTDYPLPPTEAEKKVIEARVDDEARAYQARWEEEHGRPWPSQQTQNDRKA